MTVENELIQLGDSLIFNKAARLWLPEYIMPEFVNSGIPSEADLFTESEVQMYPIGAQLAKNGNLWRYSKAGEAMIKYGFLKCFYIECPEIDGNDNHQGYEGGFHAAVVAGGTSFQITDTNALKNEYAGATLVIYDDTYGYQQYRVIGNDAGNGTYTVCYIAAPGFKAAATAADPPGITVYLNPYRDIREKTTGGAYASVAGYVRHDITSDFFFWMVTAGPISGLTGAIEWPGRTAHYRDVYANTGGEVIKYTAGYQRIGYLISRTSSGVGDNFIMLELDKEGAL